MEFKYQFYQKPDDREAPPDYRRLLIAYSDKEIDAEAIQSAFRSAFGSSGLERFVEFTASDTDENKVPHLIDVEVFFLTDPNVSIDDALRALQPLFGDVRFERDVRLSALQVEPDDTLYPRQWALPRMEAREAWNRVDEAGRGKPRVTIAVVDSGVKPDHEDFNPAVLAGYRVVPPIGPNFRDDTGHGTMLAGVIAATSRNTRGIAGICSNPNPVGAPPARPRPDLRLEAMKFDDARNPPSVVWAVFGILEAVLRGARVINLSWHVLDISGFLRIIIEFIGLYVNPGVLVVAAAGNHGSDNNRRPGTVPASYPLNNILSVMASDEHDEKPGFSNYGRNGKVDVAAPGTRIASTSIYYVPPPVPAPRMHNPAYRSYTGTSVAAAIASGAAGLLLAIDDTWTPLQIRQHLIASADRVPGLRGLCAANGRLNLRRAVCGPFTITLRNGGTVVAPNSSVPQGALLDVQWATDYTSPVVISAEISLLAPGGAVPGPFGGRATSGGLQITLPNRPIHACAVRVRCEQKNLYTDSVVFNVV